MGEFVACKRMVEGSRNVSFCRVMFWNGNLDYSLEKVMSTQLLNMKQHALNRLDDRWLIFHPRRRNGLTRDEHD